MAAPHAELAAWLQRSVRNSERRGYHKRGMDFSRVQRSGVSAILRKGESVSCRPTMRRVRLEQVWRWARGGTIYLDASCLTYGFDGAPLGPPLGPPGADGHHHPRRPPPGPAHPGC